MELPSSGWQPEGGLYDLLVSRPITGPPVPKDKQEPTSGQVPFPDFTVWYGPEVAPSDPVFAQWFASTPSGKEVLAWLDSVNDECHSSAFSVVHAESETSSEADDELTDSELLDSFSETFSEADEESCSSIDSDFHPSFSAGYNESSDVESESSGYAFSVATVPFCKERTPVLIMLGRRYSVF